MGAGGIRCCLWRQLDGHQGRVAVLIRRQQVLTKGQIGHSRPMGLHRRRAAKRLPHVQTFVDFLINARLIPNVISDQRVDLWLVQEAAHLHRMHRCRGCACHTFTRL